MRRQYLGDNLDMVKRVHFQVAAQFLQNLSVEPLITDDGPWEEWEYDCYARTLGLDPDQVRRQEAVSEDGVHQVMH